MNNIKSIKAIKLTVLITIILISIKCYSQDTSRFNIILKFHPFANLSRGSIQGGVEFKLDNKYGIDLTYGHQYIFNNQNIDTITLKPFGQTIKAEFKVYNQSKNYKKFKIQPFFSFGYWHIIYQDNDYWKPDGYSINSNNDTIREPNDYFGIKERINVFAINYGMNINYKRFLLEPNFGIGIRYKTRDIINSYKFNNYMNNWANGLIGMYKYKGFLPHIHLGIKLCYQIL